MKKPGYSRSLTYQCHPQAAWIVEKYGLSLVHPDTGQSMRLNYPEAALWDLLSRGLPVQRAAVIMTVISKMAPGAVLRWIVETLDYWAQAGWLIIGGEDG